MNSASTPVLQGRVALVTGAARGIGKAICEQFVQNGAKVVMVDNGVEINGTSADPAVVKSAAKPFGDSAVACSLDIGSYDAACQAIELAQQRWGRLDLVINNAAILRDHFIFKANPQDFDEVIRVNLAGPYYVLAAASAVFRQQAKQATDSAPYTWGRVVNLVSTAGFYGNYGQAAYASAKSGVMGLTKVSALDLKRSGVCVNAVAPFAATRVTHSIVPATEQQTQYKKHAVKVDAKYVATVVSALCSDKGVSVSGQLIGVRGRKIWLFSPSSPAVEAVVDTKLWNPDQIGEIMKQEFAPHMSPLVSDLERFNEEPDV